jgi:predicted permease
MTNLAETLAFSLSITVPIFMVLFLGTFLGKKKLIDQGFIETGSKLVFNITLPALLFINISQASFQQSTNFKLIGAGFIASFIIWAVLELVAKFYIEDNNDRGVVVQGGFRSNMGIFGLAFCFNAYGNEGIVSASLYLAALTILANILSIISLNRASNKDIGIRQTIIGIIKNPLILAIIAALPFSYFEVSMPTMVIHTGEYFANMTLPLALLCIGASLDLKALRTTLKGAGIAFIAKLVFTPLLAVAITMMFGFRGMDLGIVLLMSCAPTAAASYVMVRAMGGNAPLAANIVILTTLGSLFTTSIYVFVFSQLNFI